MTARRYLELLTGETWAIADVHREGSYALLSGPLFVLTEAGEGMESLSMYLYPIVAPASSVAGHMIVCSAEGQPDPGRLVAEMLADMAWSGYRPEGRIVPHCHRWSEYYLLDDAYRAAVIQSD